MPITRHRSALLLLILFAVLAGAGLSPRPLSAAAPTVTSIFPTSGPSGGGTVVTITGTGFQTPATTGVTFLAPAASFLVINDNTITATTPALGFGGTVTVVVTNADGTNPDNGLNNFTYIQAALQVIETGGTAVTEGGITDTYTLLPNTQPSGTVTVTIPDTAQLDITPNLLTFTPADWNLGKLVLVTAIDDAIIEGPQFSTITQTVAGGGYDGVAVPSVLVTITDNDLGLKIVESGGATNVTEGGATDTLTVALQSPPVGTATVTLVVDSQVVASPPVLSFSAGDWNVPQTVTVVAADDGLIEGDHTGTITLFLTGGGFGVVPPILITVDITDNDSRRVIVSAGDGATFDFTAIDDAQVDEGDRNRNFGNDSEFTVDEDPRRDGLLRFSVSGLAGRAVARATLRLFVVDRSDSGGQVFATTHPNWNEDTVTWNTAPGFSGSAIDEVGSVDKNTWVEFDVTQLVNGDGIVSMRLRSRSENRVDYATKERGANVAPQLIVDLAGGPTPAVSEDGAAGTYTVVLNSQPTGPTTITVIPDAELTTSPGMLNFNAANWSTPQTVTVRAVDDSDIEGTHTGVVRHTANGGGFGGVAVASVNVQIRDNDAAEVRLVETGGSTDVSEDGATDTYTLVLRGRPSGNVTITIDSGPELRTNLNQLTFTPANWNQPQTVRVEAIDDDDIEGPHSGRLSHEAFGGGFGGAPIPSVDVAIEDNDRIQVEQIPLSRGLTLVGWFGAPTTAREIIASNSRIIVVWFWDTGDQIWLLDSRDLPNALRIVIHILRGDGFFVVATSRTVLDVPLG